VTSSHYKLVNRTVGDTFNSVVYVARAQGWGWGVKLVGYCDLNYFEKYPVVCGGYVFF
jgi:hypothetical protein